MFLKHLYARTANMNKRTTTEPPRSHPMLDPVLQVRMSKRKHSNDDLCLICNSQSNVPFILQPTETSCIKLLDFIVRRAQYGDDNCVLVRDRIGDYVTFESFQNRDFKLHAGCYETIGLTHKGIYEKFMDSIIQCLNSISVATEATVVQCVCWLSTWANSFRSTLVTFSTQHVIWYLTSIAWASQGFIAPFRRTINYHYQLIPSSGVYFACYFLGHRRSMFPFYIRYFWRWYSVFRWLVEGLSCSLNFASECRFSNFS